MENDAKNTEKGLPLRIFRCKASAEYAKRVMAQQDLKFTLQCLTRINVLNKEENSDNLVCEALWNAAVIRLFSIFDGNVAIKIDILDELPEGAREGYIFFRNYRSKHIAHKVNPVDQIKAGIILSEEGSERKEVLGIGNFAMKDAYYCTPEFVNCLGNLASSLLSQIEKEIIYWNGKILEEAKSRNIDDLYKLPSLRLVAPERTYLHKEKT
jgi:hypothetical protein